jgi:hypothetical protein
LTRDEWSKLEQNQFVIVPVSGQRVIAGDEKYQWRQRQFTELDQDEADGRLVGDRYR